MIIGIFFSHKLYYYIYIYFIHFFGNLYERSYFFLHIILIGNIFNIDGRGIAVEDIKVNLKKKKLTIKTVNYTLAPFVNSVEKCTYFQKDGYGMLKKYMTNLFVYFLFIFPPF